MLGWNEEVQWRGEGLRAQLHGAAAALRPSAHGAGESWKNFILQTQGIAAPPPTHPCFPSQPSAQKKRHMRINLPLYPTSKLQMLRKGAAESELSTVTRDTPVLC
ncbi:hypothetical protein INR49_009691 [Caranx melampygus]|nr:hypothetical protein INR49_009691 [Caranx melampygus]